VESRLQRSAVALGHFLSHHAIHVGAFVLLLLVLFGWVPGTRLLLLLLLIVAGRAALLGAEALRKRRTAADRHAHTDPVGYVGPRARRELAAEVVGLLTFGLLLPFGFLLFTRDIVSLRCGHDLFGSGVAVLCLALYAWPHRFERVAGVADRRILWWLLPALPAVAIVYTGVTVHHPYLDPRRENRVELAAARVLELDSNVVAGAHADWVFAHAAEVAARGESGRAIALYRKGLHLAPRDDAARRRLAALEGGPAEAVPGAGDPRPLARGVSPEEFAHLPLWYAELPLHPIPACRIDAGLESVPRTTVVLVSLGPVPADLVAAIGHVLREELGLPACRVEDPLPLPEATRIRGIVFGRQWNTDRLIRHFAERYQPLPDAPLKYLLVTGADIYSEGSNFVFSQSSGFGALLSYARYGDPDDDWETVRQRTAKQALGALVKSFGLPPAADPNCVTSYSNGLPQFDAKGNRPSTSTFLQFRDRVDAQDARWRAHLGSVGTG
jgi:hypothetical protein